MKKKIIHFIFNLGRGGAETIVVAEINGLPEYEHVVVTLFPMNHFEGELFCDKLICLNLKSLFGLPFSLLKFRKLIKKERPDLIHTHLFWPTTIARIVTPKKIPLITTIHAFIASSVEYKKWFIRVIDKISYRFRKSIILADAQGALDEYFSFLKLKPFKTYCLYTFADINRFTTAKITKANATNGVFKFVSVGALRKQKNQVYLIEAFSKIKEYPVELHIYGCGDLDKVLQQKIDATGAKVVLKGEIKNVETVVPQYDAYIMSSTYEGFSLAVLEAMAMAMPLLLSDMPSFKEQCDDTAVYFDLNNINSLVEKVLLFSKMPEGELDVLAKKAQQRMTSNYTLTHHLNILKSIYSNTLNDYQ
ncbi:MAG: glycosyltransferase [Ferruginibacter sp.]